MKIGVISDTHIPDRANEIPRVILDVFKGMDMIIHAGDIVEMSVLDTLKTSCSNIKAVWGNMDPPEVKKKLPKKEIFSVGKFKIGIIHGWGSPNKLTSVLSEEFKNDCLDLIIYGHAHSASSQKIGNCIYFNPGTATEKIFSTYNSYGIITINDTIETKIIKL